MSTAPIKSVPGSRPYWLLVAGACLVPALLSAFTAYMNSRFSGRGSADWGAVIFESVEWLFFGALTPIAYVLARRYPLRQGALGRAVAAHLAGALLLCVGWASLGMLLGLHLRRYPALEGDLLRSYAGWILTSLPWSVFLYFAVLGCLHAFTYYREARERDLPGQSRRVRDHPLRGSRPQGQRAPVRIADPGRHGAASTRVDRALDSQQEIVVGL